jgi:VPDSG-CTERM motif
MKKPLLIPFTIIASVALFVPMASAGTVTMDYGSRHSGNGGEFNAYSADAALAPATMGYAAQTIYDAGHGTGFETFCVEENETFNPGSSYYYQISQQAVNGGVGGPHPDPISRGTAWLYGLFATGNLPGYNYTGPNGNTSAGDLQAAIWFLEDEGGANNQFVQLVATQLGSNYLLDNNGFYGVGVLNLWVNSNYTGFAQDQLILIPGPHQFEVVPDGGSTAMLLGLGFLGLFVGRWKLNRRSHAA